MSDEFDKHKMPNSIRNNSSDEKNDDIDSFFELFNQIPKEDDRSGEDFAGNPIARNSSDAVSDIGDVFTQEEIDHIPQMGAFEEESPSPPAGTAPSVDSDHRPGLNYDSPMDLPTTPATTDSPHGSAAPISPGDPIMTPVESQVPPPSRKVEAKTFTADELAILNEKPYKTRLERLEEAKSSKKHSGESIGSHLAKLKASSGSKIDPSTEEAAEAANIADSGLSESHSGAVPEIADMQNGVKGFMARADKNKNPKQKKYKLNKKRLFKTILSVGLALCLIAAAFVSFIIVTTPKIQPDNIYEFLSETSIVYDDQGNVIDSLEQNGGIRTRVDYSEMPKNLIKAIVAIEDKTFWEHHGFNVVRIFGAISDSIFKGGNISGTSTLTQQLARNVYLSETKSKRSITRKIREAYYTVQLEKNLSKERIVEAYLNTIFLGYNSNGVQAASQAYFGKDVKDLSLAQCAVLASIPKSPTKYALINRIPNEQADPDDPNILSRGNEYTMVYNDSVLERQHLVLSNMKEQGLITSSEYTEALNEDIKAGIVPQNDMTSSAYSYFTDYAINQVINDLVEQKICEDEEEARDKVYNGGLRIHTSMNTTIQQAAESAFTVPGNFPKVTSLKKDSAGNILDKNRNVLLYSYGNYIDGNGNFVLSPDEYRIEDNGSITLLKGKRLNFYGTESGGVQDCSVEFKNMYTLESGTFYEIKGGVILIPAEYKSRDSEGNLVIKSSLLSDKPGCLQFANGGLTVTSDYYQLRQKAIQPQSAMVIMDHQNGTIKAMVGGRGLEGRFLYNRADKPRQPGSSIKPLGVYGPALQSGADGNSDWTAGTVVTDEQLYFKGKPWPKNWYSGFRGDMTVRTAVEQSVNTIAVKVWNDIGAKTSVDFLKNIGVSTVEESGDVSDMNPAALALGGMTRGISPLEMAAGYASFANKGTYISPSSYTKVTNRKGEILMEASQKHTQAMDPGVAWIVTDMLRTTVTNGGAKAAAFSGSQVAGKTGTTTDNYDAWFVGLTPQYSAALWIGNDVNIELSRGSVAATELWKKIMSQSGSHGSFGSKPSNVISNNGEYYIKGTKPNKVLAENIDVTICPESGMLVTDYCPNPTPSNMAQDKAPQYYCSLHNPDPSKWPIEPGKVVDPNFKPQTPSTTPGADDGNTTTPPEDTNNGLPPGLGGGSTGNTTPETPVVPPDNSGGTPTTPTVPETPPTGDKPPDGLGL